MTIRTTNEWICNSIKESDTDWLIAVFKIRGHYIDSSGIHRQIVNSSSIGKLQKSVDWTIQSLRRKLNSSSMKFVPYIGGDRELKVASHVHALIQVPENQSMQIVATELNRYWSQMTVRAFKQSVVASVWIDQLDKNRVMNHAYYCERYEGQTDLKGSEKVMFEWKSCLI